MVHTEGVADALARATDAGSLARFVVHIVAEDATADGLAVEELRRAFRDKVSALAGSCKLAVC